LVIKALDPDWIRIGIQPKMLDPDPDEMNADPQHCNRRPLSLALNAETGFCDLNHESSPLCNISDCMRSHDGSTDTIPLTLPLPSYFTIPLKSICDYVILFRKILSYLLMLLLVGAAANNRRLTAVPIRLLLFVVRQESVHNNRGC
jgi:hypothetical protein